MNLLQYQVASSTTHIDSDDETESREYIKIKLFIKLRKVTQTKPRKSSFIELNFDEDDGSTVPDNF